MPQLLRSGDVDLRIAAGEVIALLYELGRDQNEVSGGFAELGRRGVLDVLSLDALSPAVRSNRLLQEVVTSRRLVSRDC